MTTNILAHTTGPVNRQRFESVQMIGFEVGDIVTVRFATESCVIGELLGITAIGVTVDRNKPDLDRRVCTFFPWSHLLCIERTA